MFKFCSDGEFKTENRLSKFLALSESDQDRVNQIIMEHVSLTKEAVNIPYSEPDRLKRIQDINKKIEELREERRRLIGE